MKYLPLYLFYFIIFNIVTLTLYSWLGFEYAVLICLSDLIALIFIIYIKLLK